MDKSSYTCLQIVPVAHITSNDTLNKNKNESSNEKKNQNHYNVTQDPRYQELTQDHTHQTDISIIAANQKIHDPVRLLDPPGARISSPDCSTSEERVELHGDMLGSYGVRKEGAVKEEGREGSAVTWTVERSIRQSGSQYPVTSGINDSYDSVRTHAYRTFCTCCLSAAITDD